MTSVGHIIWGPASYGGEMDASITFSSWQHALDDANDAIASIFSIPKSGTITKIGLYVNAIVGNPPAYKVGLTTITNGTPQQTAYGGSSIDDYDFTGTGWIWITLGTPATATAGDTVCVHVYPGASAPNGSNYAAINVAELFYYLMPWYRLYETSWSYGGGPIAIAIQYDDGTIAGFPVVGTAAEQISSSTTPDEVGNVFTVPIDMTVVGMVFWSGNIANYPIDFLLYDADDNILGSVTIDGDNLGSGWLVHYFYFEEGEIELTAGETYRLVCKPTETHTTNVEGWNFNSATDRQTITWPESERWYKTERTDGGSWTDTDTSIMQMGLIVSKIATGTSGSGAGPGATGYYGFVG